MPGSRIGPYEVTARIGQGGMGVVYSALDTNLGRTVALKMLPEAIAHDPDRVVRFDREARALAALNHPHIATIYGLERSPSATAIVMELVEGDTLADRIARGPIPMDEALPIARQIAEALEAAHEQGIVHRDLKPANIKVRPDGTVKVLDFGLAKLNVANDLNTPRASSEPNAISMSPTVTSPAMMTGVGALLGTAAYMAPEQAKGRPADKRSDIWAFGCVFYEMLTGKRAFPGDDVSDTLVAILRDQPDWSALPVDTSDEIRRLLRRCTEKDRTRRLPDIGAARLEVDDALSGAAGNAARVHVDLAKPQWRRALPWAVAGTFGVGLALTLALFIPSRATPPSMPLRVRGELGADVAPVVDQGAAIVLSPDGRLLVFSAQKGVGSEAGLFVRRLDQLEATPLAGTEGARNPFFSPDSRWIGFFAGGKLKKILVAGGAAVVLADAPNGRGGAWAPDGTIVFTPNNTADVSLQRVSSAGGTAQPLLMLTKGETTQRWPQILQDGKLVLFTSSPVTAAWDDANVVVQRLPAGERKIVLHGGYYARYLSSGHLVYVHEGTFFAVPFDLNQLEIVGEPVPVLPSVIASSITGGAQFAASDNGTVAYLPGRGLEINNVPIIWADRTGKTTALRASPGNWAGLLFSPDGSRLAMDISDGKQRDIWIHEWARDTLSRVTFEPVDDANPVWTPDGRRIAFASKRGNAFYNLYWQPADGSGAAERLLESRDSHLIPGSWHPSGRYLAFHQITRPADPDLMILPMEGSDAAGWKPGVPQVFLKTPAAEQVPMFSPDGRWIAYYSNESGRNEVYVRPFPGPGGQWQISVAGGTYPTWSRTKPELFYATLDQHIMVVQYHGDGKSFQADKPMPWTDVTFADGQYRRFTLHPDGNRFAMGKLPDTPAGDTVVMIFNFFDELRRSAPVKR
jgi:Tol biopolymer transport system component